MALSNIVTTQIIKCFTETILLIICTVNTKDSDNYNADASINEIIT